ncbi:MAG TPA: SDR family NAD(P)-dependent oxidoreductase, partial [Myxococcaceae bacterium]|nr:SDR family NAD(P)-dependent oxidoreductase [Myxococcaceae bacterium]
ITGGLGSLGLDLAGWLARRGARHLVLMSRREPQEAEQRALAALREQGVEVRVHSADVSAPEEVRRLVELLDSSPAPLAGIFHAAGVLADATLPNQDWERFEAVLRPKILGAWNLHLATKNLPLEHFVCFSSIASVLGSPGQSNYGAANAFLDALAHHRRAQGLPALSVNWGPWSGTGMTSQLGQQTLSRHAAGGVMMIDRLEGLHALEHLMLHGSGQALVFPVDWERFRTAFPGGEVPPFYQHIQEALHARPAEQEGQNLLAELREAAPRARRAMMVEAIKSLVGAVLRAPPDTLDEQQALREMGVDSLMGVELRNRLERRLELSIPASLLLQGPSIAEFAQATLGLLSLWEDGEEASTSTARPSWFHVHGKAAEPDIRLFCFHHLGGGASVFRSWSDELPANVQVVAVQLPGREERTREAALTRFDELLEQLVPQLHPLMDRRFSFFGHSMGTLVAFELARALRKRYGLQPERLFVSGLWAPTDHHLKKDRDYLAENDFRNLEISPSLRDDAAFMQGLMELMKHDAELLRSYRWQEEEPLSVPILSLSGSDDPIASAQEVQRWKLCTSGTLQHHVLPGKHMFIVESQKALLKLLAAELVAWSRHRGEWR